MFFKKKKKRQSGVKPKQKYKIKEFFNVPISLLTLIACLFIGSFIIQMMSENNSKSSIVDLDKLLTKNLYEKETGHRIQIEILNGCGQRYIASMYQNFLRHEGYDVMGAKNASSFDYEHSTVQLHRGDSTMAVYLSDLMGLHDSLVIEKLDGSLMFDLTLIIGSDFKELESYDQAMRYYPEY